MTQKPIPVHVGSSAPAVWDETEEQQRIAGENAAPWLRDKRRPVLARNDFDWASTGIEPRWVGFDSADCVAALAPNIFHGQGADEFDRFRSGAAGRGETAVVVSPIGGEARPNSMSIFGGSDASINLGRIESSIAGRRLGIGAQVQMAEGLDDSDRHLALRLLSLKPAPRWHSLALQGQTWEQPGGATVHHPAQGELRSIIETELGEPVVAVWISPDAVERRYIIPADVPWPQVLNWLVEQALPELVPGALRRARRELGSDPKLMTRREVQARSALSTLEEDYRARKTALTSELGEAEAAATPVRDGLLYGTGAKLVEAIRTVLESAAITVVDVDEMLGDTKNADLLCTHGGRSILVEVKSASGNAPERAYEDLLRHLREWPHLKDAPPIDGGALIISHQLRSVPQERSAEPYARPEFLAAQTEPVVTTLALLDAWREEDWDAVRRLVFGGERSEQDLVQPATIVSVRTAPAPSAPKRRWFGRR